MYHTDIMNSFLVEFSDNLSMYDITQGKLALGVVEEAPLMDPMNLLKPDIYRVYIDRSLENLNSVRDNIDNLVMFFSQTYKATLFNDKSITVAVQDIDDVEKIRPDFLMVVATDASEGIKKIVSGKWDDTDVRDKICADKYFLKKQQQLVKTTASIADVKQFAYNNTNTIMQVNTVYVQNNIIPFLRDFPAVASSLNELGTILKGRIMNSYKDLMISLNAIEEVRGSGQIDPATDRRLQYFKYNICRQYMRCCSYITGMFIRKVTFYIYNAMAYQNLYNDLSMFFPDGTSVLHENALDGKLTDLDEHVLVTSFLSDNFNVVNPFVQSFTDGMKMTLGNISANRLGVKFGADSDLGTTSAYDTFTYTRIGQSITDIATRLHLLENRLSDKNLIVDDVVNDTHFNEDFITTYNKVLNIISDISFYRKETNTDIENVADQIHKIYADLANLKANLATPTENAGKCFEYIHGLQQKLRNYEYDLDTATSDELLDMLDTVEKNYKEYILLLAKELIARINNLVDLTNTLELPSDATVPDNSVPHDYTEDCMMEEFEMIETLTEEAMLDLIMESRIHDARKNRGVRLVYEAEEAPTGDNNAQANNNGEGNEPRVEVNKAETSDNNTANNTTTNNDTNDNENNNNTNNTNDNDKKTITQKFKDFIQRILNAFRAAFVKKKAEANKWYPEAKEKIMKMKESELSSIAITKYDHCTLDDITGMTQRAKNTIASVNPDSLPNQLTGDLSNAEAYLFPDVPKNLKTKSGDTSFVARTKHYYMYGNKPAGTTKYTGPDALAHLKEMLDYCDTYEDTINKVINEMNDLSNKASEKQDAINNSGNKKQGNENKANENEKAVKSNSCITKPVQEYISSVITIMESKYYDYMLCIKKFR